MCSGAQRSGPEPRRQCPLSHSPTHSLCFPRPHQQHPLPQVEVLEGLRRSWASVCDQPSIDNTMYRESTVKHCPKGYTKERPLGLVALTAGATASSSSSEVSGSLWTLRFRFCVALRGLTGVSWAGSGTTGTAAAA